MLATHVGLPYWLQEAASEASVTVTQDPVAPLFSLIVVIIVGTTVYSLRESLDLPVAPKRSLWAQRKRKKASKAVVSRPGRFFGRSAKPSRQARRENAKEQVAADDIGPPRRPVRVPHQSELPEWEPPRDDGGLIMLEID
jgi:hypothetical protein